MGTEISLERKGIDPPRALPGVRFDELVYWTVVGLAVYMPLEDFLLKWLPVSDRFYSVARLGSEAAIYGLLVSVALGRLSEGRFLRRTPADVPIALFLLLAAVSVALNQGSWLTGAITVRTLLRYAALYYVVVNLPLTDRQVRVLVLAILGMGVAQCVVGAVQFAQGGPSSFWLPRPTALEVGGVHREFSILGPGVERGAVIGTFGHSVSMALYLMVCASLLVSLVFNGEGPGRRLVAPQVLFTVLAMVVAGVLLTYSRATFLTVLGGFGVVAFWQRHRRGLLRPLVAVAAAGVLVGGILWMTEDVGAVRERVRRVSPFENVRMAVNRDVLEGRFANTRLWMVQEVGGTVLSSLSLFGYSPDPETARRRLVAESEGALKRLLTYEPIEDVFWVAMLSYYGLLGVGVFAWLLVRLYRASRQLMGWNQGFWTRSVATGTATLVVMLVPMTFMVRTFEFRSLGFYFWLLAGLTVHRYVRIGEESVPEPEDRSPESNATRSDATGPSGVDA